MKSKILFWGSAIALLFTLGSCKAKESAYKAAYEKAMQKETQSVDETTPVVRPTPSIDEVVRKEEVSSVEGSELKRYNIVIGSFVSKTNASSLKEKMQKQGHNAFMVKNKKDVYMVIIESYDDKSSAISAKDTLKRKYFPDFKDMWILERTH